MGAAGTKTFSGGFDHRRSFLAWIWQGLVRGQILTLREQEFMQACEALGIIRFLKDL